MRYNVLVETLTNDQPPHVHVRHHGIKPGKIERVFVETLTEEYERLNRGVPKDGSDYSLDGYGSVEALDYTGYLKAAGMFTSIHVYAKEV